MGPSLLVPSVPTSSVTRLVTITNSLAAREILRRCPQVKRNPPVKAALRVW